jgi:hypothetical protein
LNKHFAKKLLQQQKFRKFQKKLRPHRGLPFPRGHHSSRRSFDARPAAPLGPRLTEIFTRLVAPSRLRSPGSSRTPRSRGRSLLGGSHAPPPPGCGSPGSSGPTRLHRSSPPPPSCSDLIWMRERKEQRRKQACGSDNLCGPRPCAAVRGSMKHAVELTGHSKTRGRRYTQHCVELTTTTAT